MEMDPSSTLTKLVAAFGPAGGLAVFLLIVSAGGSWKLLMWLREAHKEMAAQDAAHAKELSGCKLECEIEKREYREQLDKHFQTAVTNFLERDNQKRADLGTLFAKFENLVGIVSDGMTKVTESTNRLAIEIAKSPRGK